MMRLLVTHKSVSRREGGRVATYRVGDDLDGSERLLAAFGDRLDRVDTDFIPAEPDADVQAVLDANARQAEELLPGLTVGQLEVAAEFETRKGVGSAIADLLAERNG